MAWIIFMSHWRSASGSARFPPFWNRKPPDLCPLAALRAERRISAENFGRRLGFARPIGWFRATPWTALEASARALKLGLAETAVATPTWLFAFRTRPPALATAAFMAVVPFGL